VRDQLVCSCFVRNSVAVRIMLTLSSWNSNFLKLG
jgi:hypothetical protein